MAKSKKNLNVVSSLRARRVELTAQESLKRVREFSKRKEQFVGAVRKSKDRSLSA
jgi:hypothetical protein